MQDSASRHAFFSDRICAVGGLEPKVSDMKTLGSLGKCSYYMEVKAVLSPYAYSQYIYISIYICIYVYIYIYICIYLYIYMSTFIQNPFFLILNTPNTIINVICPRPARSCSRGTSIAAVVSARLGWEKRRVTAEHDGSTYGLVQ